MFRNVLVTGHGLGAAVAVLDALMPRQLDPTISINTIVFAPPRGGDQVFYRSHRLIRLRGYRRSAWVHIPTSGEAGTVLSVGGVAPCHKKSMSRQNAAYIRTGLETILAPSGSILLGTVNNFGLSNSYSHHGRTPTRHTVQLVWRSSIISS
ncbi:hypothetical protein EDB86DRAFT_2835293 [Lactarius hatsudake]|nr:hypothetical protein EDB86DRAFT_2835293 [Lactarius hatsudake]